MSPIKELAMLEPLVDTCDPKQLLSNSACILKADIYTCSKESLDFDTPFELTFARDDYLHAFVTWFDVEFSRTTPKQRFSTGPRSQTTHWKQTVFYLDAPLAVSAGEKLTGKVTTKRNAKNPRDLDIFVSYSFKGKQAQAEVKDRLYRLR
jgi:protein arginine N-methyltransferase 1